MVNIIPKTTVKMRMSGHAPSHALTHVSVRDVTFNIDEPLERGGTNLGPTPTETAVGALVGCTNVIGHKCADKLGIDIGHLDISVVCEFDRRGVLLQEEIDVPFKKITLSIISDGKASDAELQAVAQETAKYCALAKLFRQSGTEMEEIWTQKAD